ncbi:MAG: hypothetical protein OEY67_10070, partial [Gammaproteobacteria bacterium]|nr:hypothetical protein [Gammaproteobacteria bacterium]
MVSSVGRRSYSRVLLYLLSVMAVISVLFPLAGQAQEGLEDIAFYTLGKDLVIRANFSDVVRYQKHYPAKAGDTLVITLKLVGITDNRNLRDRRISKRPRGIEGIPLRDVTFEVNGTEGPRLVVHFTRKVSYAVRQGKDNRSIDIVVSGVKISRVTQDQDVEKQAARLFGQGRQALLKKQHRQAIRLFIRVLDLPENSYSADALEFLGVARERNGQRQQAVVEYKLYLKRYPKTEGADRVRQ